MLFRGIGMSGTRHSGFNRMMDRRRLLTGAMPLALAALTPGLARAAGECRPAPMGGYAACTVGLRSPVADLFARQQPFQSQWCWAACIEMVAAYYGYELPQEKIVASIFGGTYDMPADAGIFLAALNRPWQDMQGRRIMASCEVLYGAGQMAANRPDLMAIERLYGDMPIIIGTVGHAMVLSALEYVPAPGGNDATVTGAMVRDPWPESPGRRQLSPQEWYGIQLALVPRFDAA